MSDTIENRLRPLFKRRAFLFERVQECPDSQASRFAVDEIEALEWALSILAVQFPDETRAAEAWSEMDSRRRVERRAQRRQQQQGAY